MADAKEKISEAVEGAAETVANVAANVVESAEAAIAAAEAKAEAADALNDQLTEAALRDKLGERITELEDEVDECREAHETLRADLSAMRSLLASLEAANSLLQAKLETLTNPQPSIPPTSQVVETPSGTTVVTETTPTPEAVNPINQSESAGVLPAQATKTKRVRIL
jgi:chromosome segregation ATPase